MTDRKIYGTLGKVGIAFPASGTVALTDFYRCLHEDILVTSVPVPIERLTPEGLRSMSDQVAEAMGMFKRYSTVDLAFYSCTAGSLIGGKGYDTYLCNILKEASGAKEAYTTTTSVLAAMRALNSKKITMVTPYNDAINEKEKAYFEGEGFVINSINSIKTADQENQRLIEKIPPDDIYRFAVKHLDKDSDTLFLSCTGLTVFDIIDDLEKELGISVVTSNQCALWMMGKYFGAHGEKAGKLGRLFAL